MPTERFEALIAAELDALDTAGTRKGDETVIAGFLPAEGKRGPRYLLADEGDRPYLRMNANSYLGMALRPELAAAEETAVRTYGVGPGAVRFISGTMAPHVALEARLARFHGREAAMAFSSAYATVMGVLPALIGEDTAVISDALNHNCIINAIRLARPKARHVYPHNDMAALERCLTEAARTSKRAVIVTDGIFSMRGDRAPLDRVMELARAFDGDFAENAIVVVDDSHGVGACGATGRGSEEACGGPPVDVLIATLGKALGVNGGYVAASARMIAWLREKAPFYIYSNPITPGEAAAAVAALDILEGPEGALLLDHLRAMTARFEAGLIALGLETIPGDHPVVPLLVRDTARTKALVAHLRASGILATGLAYPVVPKGEDEIRFQISADHTEADIDEALAAIAAWNGVNRA